MPDHRPEKRFVTTPCIAFCISCMTHIVCMDIVSIACNAFAPSHPTCVNSASQSGRQKRRVSCEIVLHRMGTREIEQCICCRRFRGPIAASYKKSKYFWKLMARSDQKNTRKSSSFAGGKRRLMGPGTLPPPNPLWLARFLLPDLPGCL